MICPYCLNSKTRIANSRKTAGLNQTWRRHKCLACSKAFTTHEKIDLGSVLRIQPSGGRKAVAYQQPKLLFSIMRACDHRTDIEHTAYWLVSTIEQKIVPIAARSGGIVPVKDLYLTTLQVLQHFDYVAYIKYRSSNEHSLKINEQ